MAKMKLEVKHLGTIEARDIFRVMEERAARIEMLEKETEAQAEEIKRLNGVVATANATAKDYRQFWEDECDKTHRLQAIIATMDDKAVKAAERHYAAELSKKDQQIERLKEDVHRALGWIAGQRGEHPIHWSARPQDRVMTGRVVTAPAKDGEEIPF